jgi:GH15 family glucan-1,4-alpha-glucosidase
MEHGPTTQVYGEASGVTMRAPNFPAASQAADVWVRIGYSFFYTNVAIYYTTDGSIPSGTKGVAAGTTQVITPTFIRNEPNSPNNIDWWRGVIPGRPNGTLVKYKVGAWHNGGGAEIFANNSGCSDNTCNDPSNYQTVFHYRVGQPALPWPGAGAGEPSPTVGYPVVSFWKEEGVVGNNYMNVQIDQNGTVYDVYYPSAGCARGMGTRNEGYVDGLDTFPPGLPPGNRGQMNMNQAMGGIRVDGTTYWLSNKNAVGYTDVSQSYVTDTNVITSSARLNAGGNSILVQQHDFCPKGVTFPNDDGGNPNRGIYVKRYILTNLGASSKTVQFYFYMDHALNGGDGFDRNETRPEAGTFVSFDRTQRYTSASGEYNPTTTGDYNKDVSVFLAASMKLLPSVGGSSGTPATNFWSDVSADTDRGWSGIEVTLPPGVAKEIDVALIGGFDAFPQAAGTYEFQMESAVDWFLTNSMSAMQTTTQNYWTGWLASGTTIDTPDPDFDELFKRGLLATALHLDGAKGGLIAGMHNGAYPFVWPRDAVWGAMTLDRAGHADEAAQVYAYLRDITFRGQEEPGRKGFWYQKYTTDGYIVWSAPQVDETSAFPWGVLFHYNATGDLSFLEDHYVTVWEAGRSMSEDSNLDSRLRYEENVALMHANNLWEDQFDVFVYSNASVVRGLRDAATIADVLDQESCPGGPGTCNYHNDKALFTSRANAIKGGLDGRLDWNGENTDISHLGIVYPFNIYAAEDPRATLLVDRMNGVATDAFGNNRPIMNFAGEWDGLLNRYWNDTYWHNNAGPNPNGSPWFLNTMWYGCYYAMRQNTNPGKGDIDNHKYRLELLVDRLGPIGLGAEQIAPSNSLLFPGQTDFVLEAAWPNAWESMSFFVDSLMMFFDFMPDAPGNVLRLRPALPTGWSSMTASNLHVGAHRIDVTCTESAASNAHTFNNKTGAVVNFDTVVRVPAGESILAVARNGVEVGYTYDATNGKVAVSGALATGLNATTEIRVYFGDHGDADGDGDVDLGDYAAFAPCLTGPGGVATAACAVFDFENDGDVDLDDFAAFQLAF